jgi:hypothetical protein
MQGLLHGRMQINLQNRLAGDGEKVTEIVIERRSEIVRWRCRNRSTWVA